MVKTFGANNVKLWTCEDFLENPEGLFKTVCEAAGVDSTTLAVDTPTRGSGDIPPHGFELAIEWNQILSGRADLKNRKKSRLRKQLRELLRATHMPEAKPLMDAEMRAALTKRYERDLRQMRKRWPSIFLTIPPKSETAGAAASGALTTEVPATQATAVIP
jgi:hypothetical protein